MNADTSLELIEQLDFALEIPCEHSQHPEGIFGHAGPAFYYVKAQFPCGHPTEADYFYICKGGYEDTNPIRCEVCHARYTVPECWTVVGKIG